MIGKKAGASTRVGLETRESKYKQGSGTYYGASSSELLPTRSARPHKERGKWRDLTEKGSIFPRPARVELVPAPLNAVPGMRLV